MFHFIAVVVAFSLLAGSSSATVTCAPQSSTYSATPALLDAAESAKNGACTSSTFCTFDEHGICTHAQTFSDYWAVGVIDCTETQFQLACSVSCPRAPRPRAVRILI